MKIAVAQPTYLPWLGYFDLMDQVDTFVLLDSVQFEKQSWQQRNRIKTPSGVQWLTVPVKITGRSTQLIRDVEIAEADFHLRHLNLIRDNYRIAPFYEMFFEPLAAILKEGARQGSLGAMNIELIKWIATSLGIGTPLVRSSTLAVEGKRAALNLAICKALGANAYYSAIGSADYLLEESGIFSDCGIEIYFQNYIHPRYQQLFPPFSEFASVIDLLFNAGPEAAAIMCRGRGTPLLPSQIALQSSSA